MVSGTFLVYFLWCQTPFFPFDPLTNTAKNDKINTMKDRFAINTQFTTKIQMVIYTPPPPFDTGSTNKEKSLFKHNFLTTHGKTSFNRLFHINQHKGEF